MNNKYLLYIDILGFTNIVAENHERVEQIYKIIDSLNVHTHDVFETIVFSDTILVYNKIEPVTSADHSYMVMFSIEFAQDLLYRFIGKELYFRGSLTYGPFDHYKLKNINCFYGPALIQSYLAEKELPAMGLFLHSSALKYNEIFKVGKFTNNYSFVYLNQSLDDLFNDFGSYEMGGFPIKDARLFEDLDLPWNTAKDIIMLKDIHSKMNNHKDPKVRAKFLATWQMFKHRYPSFLNALEEAEFSLEAVCPGCNWTEPLKRIYEEP